MLSTSHLLTEPGLRWLENNDAQVLRDSQRRLHEAIELDPGNQHARDSLVALKAVAAQLGVTLDAEA